MGSLSTTGNSATRKRLADLSAAAPAFNPVTDIPWAHLYYAAGPAFVALGLANGNTLSTWPDEIAANAATLNNGAATYRSADAVFNSKPSVEPPSPGGGGGMRHSTTVGAPAQVALPFSIVCIFQLDTTTGSQYVMDGANQGSSGNRVLFRVSAGPVWSLYMGTDRTGGTPTTGIKAARILATTGNDTVTVNGSTVISGVNAGDVTWQGLSLSEGGGVEMDGRHAFWGIYAGDITAHGNWSALQTWVTAQYGVSIS